MRKLKQARSCAILRLAYNIGMKLNELTDAMQQIAPLRYAEEWDNTGLLINPPAPREIRKILLTIDLTERVAEEAVLESADAVIAYHPLLFNAIRKLDRAIPHDRALMLLIQNNIALYSPHTALDCAPGGTNDWLARACTPCYVAVLNPHPENPEYGQGRLVTLAEPVSAARLAEQIKDFLGIPAIRFAGDFKKTIRTVALCAGAGTSVIGDSDADLLLTGEMSHHHVLAAVQRGQAVILCEHSNTERGYLPELAERLKKLAGNRAEILISEADHDPLRIS